MNLEALKQTLAAHRARLELNPNHAPTRAIVEQLEATIDREEAAQASTQRRLAERKRVDDARRAEITARLDAEANARQQERDARAKADREALEQRLIAEYMRTAPATTEQEARAALPTLLDEHRQREAAKREAMRQSPTYRRAF